MLHRALSGVLAPGEFCNTELGLQDFCLVWRSSVYFVMHRALSGVLASEDFVTQSFIRKDFSWFGEALRIVKPAVICESSVHCGGAKICTELCPGYLSQGNFATQSLGCRIFAWFGEALCIVGLPKFERSSVLCGTSRNF